MIAAPRDLLRAMFGAAVKAASSTARVPLFLPPKPNGRVLVVGAGKASAAMTKAVEDCWDGPLTGLVVTRYGHCVPCERVEIVEAAHPVPDARGEDGARRILAMVRELGPDDLVLALISGGGSALLSLPADGLTLEDKQAINAATVTVKGQGRGGRNVEFLLSLALELDGLPGVFAIAADTDGIDGAGEAAGALIAPDTLARAAAMGLDAKQKLAANDAHRFFENIGDQVFTGPTGRPKILGFDVIRSEL